MIGTFIRVAFQFCFTIQHIIVNALNIDFVPVSSVSIYKHGLRIPAQKLPNQFQEISNILSMYNVACELKWTTHFAD